MDTTVRKVVEMLDSHTPEIAQAAARVLSELKPKEAEAVDSLARALGSSDFELRGLALEALGAVGAAARRAAAPIAALLEDQADLATRAAEVLVGMGPAVLPALQKLLSNATSPRLRKALTLVVAEVPAPLDAARLVGCLEENDPRLIDAACLSLERQAPDLDAGERKLLAAALRRFLAAPGREADLSPFSATLRMLGSLDHPAAVEAVFPWSAPEHGAWVRSSALRALKTLAAHLDPERHLLPLLGFLAESDHERIVGPVIEILYPLDLPKGAARTLEDLTTSPIPSVRKLALEKLEKLNPKWLVPRLLALVDQDPLSREKATEILARIPGGLAAATKEIQASESPERVRALARVLAARKNEVGPDVWEKIAERALELDSDERPLSEAYAEIAKALAPEAFCYRAAAVAARHKRAKRYPDAARCLRWAKGLSSFDDDCRFLLAVCELKGSRKDLSRASRLTDPCLSLFQALAHEKDFPWLERIRKEKPLLEPEELFYLGFHFAEGSGAEKGLGAALLADQVARSRGSKLGKAAKNKLKAEGLLPNREQDSED